MVLKFTRGYELEPPENPKLKPRVVGTERGVKGGFKRWIFP